ncbi:short-chain collagen C4-like [Littorina saxatilis]|uniref:Short-chain collagen C4-like n=1 Tax=Littorina saxatilis TaxID=31220 RepID=A0AAN9AMU0_9CAEN
MTAIFLLCLAVSSVSCTPLKTQTSSDERLERSDDNVFSVKEETEDLSAVKLPARSQERKRASTVEQHTEEIDQLRRSLRSLEDNLRTKRGAGEGSTFVRWGRKTCPSGTSTVYVGIAGGKQHNKKGSGTNRLCLTKSPVFDYTSLVKDQYGLVYGAEYQYIGSHHDHNVPCSVCLVPKAATIMVPGTKYCPSGWTRQYYGHLTSAQYYDHYATEYVCLDNFREDEDSGYTNEDGLLFYYVIARCGSLPCPPYRQSKVITCAVCSK